MTLVRTTARAAAIFCAAALCCATALAQTQGAPPASAPEAPDEAAGIELGVPRQLAVAEPRGHGAVAVHGRVAGAADDRPEDI